MIFTLSLLSCVNSVKDLTKEPVINKTVNEAKYKITVYIPALAAVSYMREQVYYADNVVSHRYQTGTPVIEFTNNGKRIVIYCLPALIEELGE